MIRQLGTYTRMTAISRYEGASTACNFRSVGTFPGHLSVESYLRFISKSFQEPPLRGLSLPREPPLRAVRGSGEACQSLLDKTHVVVERGDRRMRWWWRMDDLPRGRKGMLGWI
jgi:hypothetical protein